MSEVPDGMMLLLSHMNEIAAKADRFNEMVGCLEAMPVRKLMTRVEALGDKATRAGGFKRGDCLNRGAHRGLRQCPTGNRPDGLIFF